MPYIYKSTVRHESVLLHVVHCLTLPRYTVVYMQNQSACSDFMVTVCNISYFHTRSLF